MTLTCFSCAKTFFIQFMIINVDTKFRDFNLLDLLAKEKTV